MSATPIIVGGMCLNKAQVDVLKVALDSLKSNMYDLVQRVDVPHEGKIHAMQRVNRIDEILEYTSRGQNGMPNL